MNQRKTRRDLSEVRQLAALPVSKSFAGPNPCSFREIFPEAPLILPWDPELSGHEPTFSVGASMCLTA